MNEPKRSRILCVVAAAAIALAGAASPARAQAKSLGGGAADEALKTEIEFARILIEDLQVPDLGEIVLKRLPPEAGPMLRVLKIKGLLATGKFDEVLKVISAEPDQDGQNAWAMKLALADGYFAWGKYPDAQKIYEAFFAKFPGGPSEAMNRFFMESAYKYGQMMLLMKKDAAAVSAYERVLQAKLQKHERRQVLGEMSEILVRMAEAADPQARPPLFAKIEKNINELMWNQDLWFGKSIVMMAHIKMIKGETEAAMKLIEDYRSQLEEMDRSLKEETDKEGIDFVKLSPMAQVRYMIGVMLHKEAEKLAAGDGDREKTIVLLAGPRKADGKRDTENGALGHFYNVFIHYPSCPWAPDAGKRARRVEDLLRGFGATIKTAVTDEQWAKVARIQFTEARSLFSQGQYETAVDNYYVVLNLFPETDISVEALGELVRCYVEMPANDDAPYYAPMIAGYLAERFSGNSNLATKAGDQVVRVAELFGERGRPEEKDKLYEQFFRFFTGHAMAPSTQFRFGEKRYEKEDYAGALKYFQGVAETYARMPLAIDAFNRVASCHSKLGDTTNEIVALQAYLDALDKAGKKNSIGALDARNRMAYAHWRAGKEGLVQAIKSFQEMIQLLTPEKHPWNGTPEEAKLAQDILESAMFFKATGFASIREPADKVAAFREAALNAFSDLIKRFPKSKYAPRAMSQMATLYTLNGDADKATDALRRLEKEYPDSADAKNAKFLMYKNLMDMGFKQEAYKYLREMFTAGGAYSDSQILSAATGLFDGKEYEMAITGFDRVIANAGTNRFLHEPALLYKGKSLVELQRFPDAVKTLVSFTNSYPRTANLIDASLALGKAYGELAMKEADRQKRTTVFNLAVDSMQQARRFTLETDPGGRARLGYEIGRTLERRAQAEKEHGSADRATEYLNQAVAAYQVLILLSNVAHKDVAPWVQKADVRCVPLLKEMGRLKDALDNCDTHLKRYPDSPVSDEIRRMRNELRVILVTKGELTVGAAEREPVATATTDAPATNAPSTDGVKATTNAAPAEAAPTAK
jgi:TolA-binding protein